ncbi:Uncharacterised protein [Shigella sonnei]|nr:Uncharacterised protein [Shigella sonnei]
MRQGDGDNYVGQPGAEHANHKERQNRGREGHKHIGDAHGGLINAPANQPGAAANNQP